MHHGLELEQGHSPPHCLTPGPMALSDPGTQIPDPRHSPTTAFQTSVLQALALSDPSLSTCPSDPAPRLHHNPMLCKLSVIHPFISHGPLDPNPSAPSPTDPCSLSPQSNRSQPQSPQSNRSQHHSPLSPQAQGPLRSRPPKHFHTSTPQSPGPLTQQYLSPGRTASQTPIPPPPAPQPLSPHLFGGSVCPHAVLPQPPPPAGAVRTGAVRGCPRHAAAGRADGGRAGT